MRLQNYTASATGVAAVEALEFSRNGVSIRVGVFCGDLAESDLETFKTLKLDIAFILQRRRFFRMEWFERTAREKGLKERFKLIVSTRGDLESTSTRQFFETKNHVETLFWVHQNDGCSYFRMDAKERKLVDRISSLIMSFYGSAFHLVVLTKSYRIEISAIRIPESVVALLDDWDADPENSHYDRSNYCLELLDIIKLYLPGLNDQDCSDAFPFLFPAETEYSWHSPPPFFRSFCDKVINAEELNIATLGDETLQCAARAALVTAFFEVTYQFTHAGRGDVFIGAVAPFIGAGDGGISWEKAITENDLNELRKGYPSLFFQLRYILECKWAVAKLDLFPDPFDFSREFGHLEFLYDEIERNRDGTGGLGVFYKAHFAKMHLQGTLSLLKCYQGRFGTDLKLLRESMSAINLARDAAPDFEFDRHKNYWLAGTLSYAVAGGDLDAREVREFQECVSAFGLSFHDRAASDLSHPQQFNFMFASLSLLVDVALKHSLLMESRFDDLEKQLTAVVRSISADDKFDDFPLPLGLCYLALCHPDRREFTQTALSMWNTHFRIHFTTGRDSQEVRPFDIVVFKSLLCMNNAVPGCFQEEYAEAVLKIVRTSVFRAIPFPSNPSALSREEIVCLIFRLPY